MKFNLKVIACYKMSTTKLEKIIKRSTKGFNGIYKISLICVKTLWPQIARTLEKRYITMYIKNPAKIFPMGPKGARFPGTHGPFPEPLHAWHCTFMVPKHRLHTSVPTFPFPKHVVQV